MSFNLNHEGQRTQGKWFLAVFYLKCTQICEFTYQEQILIYKIELFILKSQYALLFSMVINLSKQDFSSSYDFNHNIFAVSLASDTFNVCPCS